VELPVSELVEQTGVPTVSRIELDLEADAAIGIDRARPVIAHADRQLAAEIPIPVQIFETGLRIGPLREDTAPANDAARPHLKQIGEIAPDGDLEIESHRFQAIVDDVEIFVNAAADRAAEGQPQCPGRYRALLAGNGAVDEEYA